MSAQHAVTDQVTWGDRLRRIRINRHMDQSDMADLLGVAKPTVGKYELAVSPPRQRKLVENTIELRFGAAAAAFLRGNGLQSTDYRTLWGWVA